MRSLLFVPADSPRKLQKSLDAGADALIIDLEDSVAPAAKPAAREAARDFIAEVRRSANRPALVLRVNSLDSGAIDADLDAVMSAAPDMILLPKSRNGGDVQHLAAKLAVCEARHGLEDGATRIIAIATETAAAMFGLGTYEGCSRRLRALTWGAEDLSAALGATAARDAAGAYTEPYRLARSLTLIGARAALAQPIDTVFVRFTDEAAFRRECEEAARDGFTGKLAIHPSQTAIINEIFSPSPAAIARAQKIIAAFEANPGAGVLSIDGEMLDQPHLKGAQRLLAARP